MEFHDVRLVVDALNLVILVGLNVQADSFELDNFTSRDLVTSKLKFVNTHEEKLIRSVFDAQFKGVFVFLKHLDDLDQEVTRFVALLFS